MKRGRSAAQEQMVLSIGRDMTRCARRVKCFGGFNAQIAEPRQRERYLTLVSHLSLVSFPSVALSKLTRLEP